MTSEIIEKIKSNRLNRKAKKESGILEEIKALQKEIVNQSFSNHFCPEVHRELMQQLKALKVKHKSIKTIMM